ncbi:MAG: UDP-2,4-diacetamido-2,4,6-trideoxy-beta-L-altropyranose hydrolase [Sedimentitalea sp.]
MSGHVLVRADGNARIGLGHVMRTMSVACELQRTGARITYLCRPLPLWAETLLQARGFDLLTLALDDAASQTEDADATVQALERIGADMVLLDHYDLTADWTKRVKARSALFMAVFDDLASDARDVDVLIDASPGRVASDYIDLVPPSAVCLTGPDYAALRPEFALARGQNRSGKQAMCRIAISMGGVDPTNVTLACLEALDARPDVDLTVILSSAAPHIRAVRERIAKMRAPTRLLLDRTDMARILQSTDLVVGAGGTSALERCVLGVPSVIVVLAENQAFNAANLAKAKAALVLSDLSASALVQTLEPLIEDADLRADMGQSAAALCDGLGAPRVAGAILAARHGAALRPVTMDDMALIYDWQCEPQTRRFARNPTVPKLAEHEAWFANRMSRAKRDPFYIILSAGKASGFVRLDPASEGDTCEVSIVIAQHAQGRGLGRVALGLLRLAHPKRKIAAAVHPQNAASQRVFERAGYQRTAPEQFVSVGWSESVERQQNGN